VRTSSARGKTCSVREQVRADIRRRCPGAQENAAPFTPIFTPPATPDGRPCLYSLNADVPFAFLFSAAISPRAPSADAFRARYAVRHDVAHACRRDCRHAPPTRHADALPAHARRQPRPFVEAPRRDTRHERQMLADYVMPSRLNIRRRRRKPLPADASAPRARLDIAIAAKTLYVFCSMFIELPNIRNMISIR